MLMQITTCPFCHKEDSELFRAKQPFRDQSDQSRDFYRCGHCSIIYPRPRNTEYDKGAQFQLCDPKFPISRFDYVFNLLKRYQKEYRFKNALDIGTYTGRFCYFLEQLGVDACGIETQPEAVQLAREKSLKVFHGYFPDRMPPELMGVKFDLIACNEAIYYFPDLYKALKHAYDILHENGIFFIKFHHIGSHYYSNGQSLFSRYGDSVQSVLSIESLRFCLENVGFVIREMLPFPDDYFGYFYGVTSGTPQPVRKIFNMIYRNVFFDQQQWIKKADRIILVAQKERL